MTAAVKSYEHLRSQHAAVVYELVHQAELSFRGTEVPEAGPDLDCYLADIIGARMRQWLRIRRALSR